MREDEGEFAPPHGKRVWLSWSILRGGGNSRVKCAVARGRARRVRGRREDGDGICIVDIEMDMRVEKGIKMFYRVYMKRYQRGRQSL